MTVEAPAPSRTVRRNAMRQSNQPIPITTLDPANPVPAIAATIAAVVRNHRGRWCGSFVFIDPALRVFVLSEERAVAIEWTRARFGDLVGKYVPFSRDTSDAWLAPTPEGLAEDFADHLRDLGVSP